MCQLPECRFGQAAFLLSANSRRFARTCQRKLTIFAILRNVARLKPVDTRRRINTMRLSSRLITVVDIIDGRREAALAAQKSLVTCIVGVGLALQRWCAPLSTSKRAPACRSGRFILIQQMARLVGILYPWPGCGALSPAASNGSLPTGGLWR